MKRTIHDTFRRQYAGFCGWPEIRKALATADDVSRTIFIGLFVTGARAMELPTLRRSQVDLDFSEDIAMVKGMHVEKQRDRINLVDAEGRPVLDEYGRRRFYLKSKPGYRTFPIRKDEPLAREFIEHVSQFDGDEKPYPYTYNQIYYRIALIEAEIPRGVPKREWCAYKGPWWPHRIRSERACQLIRDYWFDIFRLKRWFGWQSSLMPELYGSVTPMDLVAIMRRR